MGLFRSITEFFKSLSKQAEGSIDQAADRMRTDADALKSKYDDVIREKIKNIKDYRGAMSNMVHQKDKMVEKAKELTQEVGKLEELKAGAAAKVRKLVSSLKGEGKTQADIEANPEFAEGKQHYSRFAEQLAQKQAEIEDLEQRASEIEAKMGGHKEQLGKMLKEIDQLREEAAESVAEVAAAGEEMEARNMMSNMGGGSNADEELAKLREIRARSNAEAKIAHELADSGADADSLTKEFLEKAEAESAADDFASLVGLGDTPSPKAEAKPAAPESSDPGKPAEGGDGEDFKFPE